MDDIFPFALLAPDDTDWDNSDQQREFKRYCQRQQAIRACLDGKMSPSDVLELLADHEVDVDTYLDEVSANVSAVMSGRLLV